MKQGHLRAADQLLRNARAGTLQSGKAQEREAGTVQSLCGDVGEGARGLASYCALDSGIPLPHSQDWDGVFPSLQLAGELDQHE